MKCEISRQEKEKRFTAKILASKFVDSHSFELVHGTLGIMRINYNPIYH